MVDKFLRSVILLRTLLHSLASEPPCSLVLKVRALNAHTPNGRFSDARMCSCKPSIGTIYADDKKQCACAYFGLFQMLGRSYKDLSQRFTIMSV